MNRESYTGVDSASMGKKEGRKMTWVYWLAGACVLWIAARWVVGRAQPSHELGEQNGQLAPCPASPNCVSSQATESTKHVEAIPLDDTLANPLDAIETAINTIPRSRVISKNDRYLHAEFRSLLLGYVDDVEFLVDEKDSRIEVRSASRVGHSDLGVNRKRVEEIRRKLHSSDPESSQ